MGIWSNMNKAEEEISITTNSNLQNDKCRIMEIGLTVRYATYTHIVLLHERGAERRFGIVCPDNTPTQHFRRNNHRKYTCCGISVENYNIFGDTCSTV